MPTPIIARAERQEDGYWRLHVNGRIVMFDESYAVVSAVYDALLHPRRFDGTEANEIADNIRKAADHGAR